MRRNESVSKIMTTDVHTVQLGQKLSERNKWRVFAFFRKICAAYGDPARRAIVLNFIILFFLQPS